MALPSANIYLILITTILQSFQECDWSCGACGATRASADIRSVVERLTEEKESLDREDTELQDHCNTFDKGLPIAR